MKFLPLILICLAGCATVPSSKPKVQSLEMPPMPMADVQRPTVQVQSSMIAADIAPVVTEPVKLAWDYPLIFKVYSSDDLSIPMSDWPLLTNIVVTNFTYAVPTTGPQRFFVTTAKMVRDGVESDFSNIATNEMTK